MADERTPAMAPEESPEERMARLAVIEVFAEVAKGKRKAAIDGRAASGIETIWQEDTDHYEGIDDANRGTASEAKLLKGRSTTDGLSEDRRTKQTRSTVFLKITRPYVDAAAARVGDMLLPTDGRNWALKAEPKPEFIKLLKDAGRMDEQGNVLQPVAAGTPTGAQPPQKPTGMMQRLGAMFGMGGQPAPQQPGQPPAQPNPLDEAEAAIRKAKASAEQAQTVIDDWLVQCRYHAEVRKVIESAAKVGTGILKGPHPAFRRKRAALENADGTWSLHIREDIAPESRWVNHWNFYPDPNCGADIQKGAYVFECDDITARGLQELARDDSYLKEVIEQCLAEGPISAEDGTRKLKDGEKVGEDDLYQIWYGHMQVSRRELVAAGCKCGERETYPAIVTMVNDRIIKIRLSPLDCGEFPYDVMVWQARPDHWAGVGVARQMRECQKGANAAVRALQDNATLSSGPQIIVDRSKLIPANGSWTLTPRKVWYTKNDSELEDARKSFLVVNIETRQQELLAIIMFWVSKAEEVTGLPMLLQGQMGVANPTDKVGIANIMNNNGSTVLRRIARTFDDRITEPHIGRYYEFLLLHGPDEAKGQFTVDARGGSALVDRDLQAQQLVNLLGLAVNPAYRIDPQNLMKEILKAWRVDYRDLELSDEKYQQMTQQPESDRIAAARIMAEAGVKKNADTLAAEERLEQLRQQFDGTQADLERQAKLALKQIDERLAMAELSSEERQHAEKQRVLLADVVMRLNTQKDLFVAGARMDLHKDRNPTPQVSTPGAEPPQRAPVGHAFTQ